MPRKKKEIEDQESPQAVSGENELFLSHTQQLQSTPVQQFPTDDSFSREPSNISEGSSPVTETQADNETPGLFSNDESSGAQSFADQGYLVLARRYRPQTFDDIVGQEHVRESLRRAILEKQVAHAYLFSGPRGTGKTSTARILAKALNCQDHGPRPDPCGRCASCRAITAGSSLDVIEIDAASNTGVDNIRDLKTGAVLAPFSRYKVYIVDEVHMLSMQAFNALLKTLEEPPPRVIFILATTELHKVPPTIVSRCQCFQFRRFTTYEIVNHLDRILDREASERRITVDPEEKRRILELIARAAEGGMRDAQVALDQVLVLCRDRLDYETVRRFLGGIQSDVLQQFVRGILERKTKDLLLLLDDLISRGLDLERFVKNVAEFCRNLLLVRQVPEAGSLVDLAPDQVQSMKELANQFSTSSLINLCSAMVRLVDAVKASSSARFLFELEIVKLTCLDPEDDLGKLIATLKSFERLGTPTPTTVSVRHGVHAPSHGAEKLQEGTDSVQAGGATKTPFTTKSSKASSEEVEVAPVERTNWVEATEPKTNTRPAEQSLPSPSEGRGTRTLEEGSLPAPFVEQIISCVAQNVPQLARALRDVGGWELRSDYLVVRIDPSDRYLDGVLRGKSAQPLICEAVRQVAGRTVQLRVEYLTPEGKNPTELTARSQTSGSEEEVEGPDSGQCIVESPDAMSADVNDEDAESPTSGAFAAAIDEPAGEDDGFVDVEAIQRRFQPPLKGEELRRYIDAHPDLGNVVEDIKKVFDVDIDSISLKRQTIEE